MHQRSVDEKTKSETGETQPSPQRRPGKLVYVLVALASVLAGAGAAWFVLVPAIARAPSQTATAARPDSQKPPGETKSVRVPIENVVVNPAGSQGTRFLMASVVLEVGDAETEREIKLREAQVRDLIGSVMEVRTLERLTMPGARDSLKDAIRTALGGLLGRDAIVAIYLPQFVIQ
jgi:flagellar FliL protein